MRVAISIAFLLFPLIAPASDSIDLTSGWVFQPDPKDEGIAAGWMKPDYDDSTWKPIKVGTRWEDEGYRDVDGVAWYRLRFDYPSAFVTQWASLQLGGVNDACTIYCNGVEFDSFGETSSRTMYDTPVIAMIGSLLLPGKQNLIAIRVFDWGGNGGLWRAPVQLRLDAGNLPWQDLIHFRANTLRKKLHVEFDARSFGNKALEKPVTIKLTGLGGPGNAQTAQEQSVAPAGFATFDVGDAMPQTACFAKVTFHGALGDGGGAARYTWPGAPEWPPQYAALTIKNNFVTDLYRKNVDGFLTPRDGWVYFSWDKDGGAEPPALRIDQESEALVWRRNPKSGVWESMRRLSEGRHTLTDLGNLGDALSIRAIPEIAFCYFPYDPHVKAYGMPDLKFLEAHVLSDVNTIVARSRDIETNPLFEQWRREGRQWLANGPVPGLKAPQPPEPGAVTEEWLKNASVTQTGYAGMIVDEFTSETDAHYAAWTTAVQMLHDSPEMKGKQFYAWCVDLFRDQGPIDFCTKLKALGYTFSWEKYVREEASPEVAERWINQSIAQGLEEWQRKVPGIERNLVVCLGYFSAPPETLDVDPGVDYNVFLDMQFNLLANDPRCFGLRGVMEYLSDYADEEYLRYAQQLFRHYCIEGHRERMNTDPYLLPHVQNPDFAKGLEGWAAEPAADGAVTINAMDGFSFLEGRYPRYKEGDQFCQLKRFDGGPSHVRQTIRQLTPGRLYSLKMYSADPGHLDRNTASALSIAIEGAEPLDEYSFDYVFPSSYAHVVPPYDSEHPAHMTFHRRVFRAIADTASISLGDENASPGQVTAFNFVQIQPYHAP